MHGLAEHTLRTTGLWNMDCEFFLVSVNLVELGKGGKGIGFGLR